MKVGLPASSRSRAKAEADGVSVVSPAEAARWADVVMLLTPDTAQPALYETEIAPGLDAGQHADVRARLQHPLRLHRAAGRRRRHDGGAEVARAPRARGVRRGRRHAGAARVHQDATGNARALALSYARALGTTRAGVLETTFAEETETDLFGEQTVLCGGVSALVKAGFDTLVEAGYQPEIAYFECLHELKLIVDLMYRGGLNYMRYSVSDTAEHGDYTGGPRIVTDETRQAMKQILAEIQDGTYADKWIAENEAGRPWFNEVRAREQSQLLEQVGADLREMMPFLKPVRVTPGGTPSTAPAKTAPGGARRLSAKT